VTLDEFSAICQSRRELAPFWQALAEEVHKLVTERVRSRFLDGRGEPSEEKFFAARHELEMACQSTGIEIPDLSFKKFKDWILRY